MKSIISTIKENAKKALNNKFGRAFVIILIYLAVNIFFVLLGSILSVAFDLPLFVDITNTPQFFIDNHINITLPSLFANTLIAIITFLIVTPLEFGVSNWFYRLIGEENDGILSAFYFFESAKLMVKTWFAKLNIIIRMMLWSILFLFPSAVVWFFADKLKENLADTTTMIIYSA